MMKPDYATKASDEEIEQGHCCEYCLYHLKEDGNWCIYAQDDYGNEVWQEIFGPAESYSCDFWEEGT